MGNGKNSLKKKVLDALKDELQGLSEDENNQLTGGFSGASGLEADAAFGANLSCPDTTNSNCNTVSGCGVKSPVVN